jgi:ArsR family transcriptional regulator
MKSGQRSAISALELRAVSRVLSDPRRFQILKQIAAQSCTACSDLRAAFPITPATLCHHMKELESCGLIEITRRGKFVDGAFRRGAWETYLAELKKI